MRNWSKIGGDQKCNFAKKIKPKKLFIITVKRGITKGKRHLREKKGSV